MDDLVTQTRATSGEKSLSIAIFGSHALWGLHIEMCHHISDLKSVCIRGQKNQMFQKPRYRQTRKFSVFIINQSSQKKSIFPVF